MTELNNRNRFGATPGKLVLVGVLAVVLITVLVRQVPSQPNPTTKKISQENTPRKTRDLTPRQAALSSTPPVKTTPSISERFTNNENLPNWPVLPIESILQYDPFMTPAWLVALQKSVPAETKNNDALAETKVEQEKKEVLAKLHAQGTMAIVISAGEKRAIMGDQAVRIGDLVDGFKITNITKEGVVLSEIK